VPVSTSAVSSSIGNKPRRRSPYPLHPFQVLLLGGAASFVVSGLLSDWAYFSTHEIQWKNFASWLIMGGLVVGGIALLWALVDAIGADQDRNRRVVYVLLLLAAWILGFIDDLIHAKDAWASMPEALIASAIVALLAIAATWLGLSICARGR
jgi:uncharacterized membrane protein